MHSNILATTQNSYNQPETSWQPYNHSKHHSNSIATPWIWKDHLETLWQPWNHTEHCGNHPEHPSNFFEKPWKQLRTL